MGHEVKVITDKNELAPDEQYSDGEVTWFDVAWMCYDVGALMPEPHRSHVETTVYMEPTGDEETTVVLAVFDNIDNAEAYVKELPNIASNTGSSWPGDWQLVQPNIVVITSLP